MRTIHLTGQLVGKIAVTIGGVALAISVIWYAWKISTFNSLSKTDAEWWIRASELLLLGSAVLLTVGLFGEWPDSESWKERLLYKGAKVAVIVGVLGELLGDGGIFQAGDRIQQLEGKAITAANSQAAEASERAAKANERAEEAHERAAKAELELAKIELPRKFQPLANFEAAGRAYLSGTKFDLFAASDVEPMMLAIKVRQALLSIGMIEQPSVAAYHWTPPNGGMSIGAIIRTGVAVRSCGGQTADLNKPTSARLLGALLADSGLGTKENPVFNEPWDPNDCADPSVLHVEIGSKPMTAWQLPNGTSVAYPKFQLAVPNK